MDDVRAATSMARKNVSVMMYPSTGDSMPIWANMYGSVSYTSEGPAPGAIPAAKTAGIIAKPLMRAKPVSNTDVQMPDFRILSSFFMKEE